MQQMRAQWDAPKWQRRRQLRDTHKYGEMLPQGGSGGGDARHQSMVMCRDVAAVAT